MTVYIHHRELMCSLGSQVKSCTDSYLNYNNTPSQVSIDRLNDPVVVPYFLAEKDPTQLAHERMYQVLEKQVGDTIHAQDLSCAERLRTGLFVGSSSFSANHSEHSFFKDLEAGKPDALNLPLIGYGKITEDLRKRFGLSFCSHTYATACTSSANALLYAKHFIEQGQIDHAIVIGYEFINETTALGFHGLDLLSPSCKLRSFDSRRDGLILGEGCGTLFLSKEPKHSSIEFLGGAINTDSFSLTAANPDGNSIAAVYQKVFNACNINKEEVLAIKTHGTASIMNDEAEAAGICRTFGSEHPKLFAIKPYIGHTLGACGAIENILVIESLLRNIIPSNPGLACSNFADSKLGVTLAQENTTANPGVYLMDFFAFGGNNTVLAIKKN